MKRSIVYCIALAGLTFNTGCATYLANQHAQATSPIRMTASQEGGAVAVDLFNLDALKERPWLHGGAFALDVLTVFGGYAVGEKNGLWGGSSRRTEQAGPDSPRPGSQVTEGGGWNVSNTGSGTLNVTLTLNGAGD